MQISVIIPTHNRRDSLRLCLDSVLLQDHSASQVIVVDDGSQDGTARMLAEEYPQVQVLHLAQQQGPAAARNRGLQAATGDAVAFTDDDCVVPQHWLAELSRAFETHPELAAVGGYQEAPDELLEANPVAQADRAIRLHRWGDRALAPQTGGFEIPDIATSNAAYRLHRLVEVGGFDESFPVAAGEDADLKLRLAARSWPLLYLPLKVEHRRAYTLGAQWRQAWRRGIGAYHFESRHRRPPGFGRLLLRLLKRSLQFLLDLGQVSWRVAAVIYITRLADVGGQLQAAVQAARSGRR
jgi:GT2 family glycosyltransferase